jgi:dihydrofolate reductase
MKVSAIVAVSANNVIGKDNDLIWRLSEDLKRFKRITSGHSIIMGRLNYESIGRPLPNRTNIIITRQTDYQVEGCVVVNSVEEALNVARENGDDEAFIIGGAQIYRLAMPLVEKIYLTEVHQEFDGDVFFDELGDEWQEVHREGPFPKTEKDQCEYSFVDLERKK